jgi:outer membrane receptor protein involved in Fe transport
VAVLHTASANVIASRVASTASQGRVGAADLRLRPLMREGELLETVPGVIVTQHSGDGKSNQLFVRGFNLDHGTDFQTRVEGMPVNMASHAHGRDTRIELIEFVNIDYRLGAYHAAIADFGSAEPSSSPALTDRPFSRKPVSWLHAAGGASIDLGRGSLLLGGEAKRYDGPWRVEQQLRKFSALARYAVARGRSRVSVLGMAYRNDWDASDQIPMRTVTDGTLDRFGQVDPSLGGASSRYSLSAQWDRAGARSVQQVQLFGIASTLDLYSNFTYFLENEYAGDQFNQREGRTTIGLNATHKQPLSAGGVEHLFTLGLQHARSVDDIGLHRTRSRAPARSADDVTERARVSIWRWNRWRPRLRTVLGVRGDAYSFDAKCACRQLRHAQPESPAQGVAIAPTSNPSCT